MPIEVLANNAAPTLSVAVTTTPVAGTSETWTVTSTASFPQIGTAGTQQFRCVVGPTSDLTPELVIVTAVNTTTTMTVSRGAEGSTIKTHAVGDPVINVVTAGSLAGDIEVNTVTAKAVVASGLSGATAASRYVGATASGAPTAGTFAVGDMVVAQNGTLWICTAAGTPGTWRLPIASWQ